MASLGCLPDCLAHLICQGWCRGVFLLMKKRDTCEQWPALQAYLLSAWVRRLRQEKRTVARSALSNRNEESRKGQRGEGGRSCQKASSWQLSGAQCWSGNAHPERSLQLYQQDPRPDGPPTMRFAAVILHCLSFRLPLLSFSLLVPAYIPRG